MDIPQTLEESLLLQRNVLDFVDSQPNECCKQSNIHYFTPSMQIQSVLHFRGYTFNQFQLHCIQNIHANESAVVAAPTAVGKTLLAQYFISQQLSQKRTVYYLLPIQALAQEIFDKMQYFFPNQVGYNYGNQRCNASAAVQVMTYEKFEILTFSQQISDCFIVIDEFHFIQQSLRGACIERIILFNANNQFLCMSATLRDLDKIQQFTNFKVLAFNEQFRKFPTGVSVIQQYQLDEIIHQILDRNENAVVFCQSKARNVQMALKYQQSDQQVSNVVISNKTLLMCLRRQTAFHSASLPFQDKQAIQQLFGDGKIRLLFATTTLAYGVNLQADNVIIIFTEQFDQAEVTQIIGRAGRTKPGNAYLIGQGANTQQAQSFLADDMLKTVQICKLKKLGYDILARSLLSHYQRIDLGELLRQSEKILADNGILHTCLTDFGVKITQIYQPLQSILKAKELLTKYLPRKSSYYVIIQKFLEPLTESQQLELRSVHQRKSQAQIFEEVMLRQESDSLNELAQPYEAYCQNILRLVNLLFQCALSLGDGLWQFLLLKQYFCVSKWLELGKSAIQQSAASAGGSDEVYVSCSDQGAESPVFLQLCPVDGDDFVLKVQNPLENAQILILHDGTSIYEELRPGVNRFALSAKATLLALVVGREMLFWKSHTICNYKRPVNARCTSYADLSQVGLGGGKVLVLCGSEQARQLADGGFACVDEIGKDYTVELGMLRGELPRIYSTGMVNDADFGALGYAVCRCDGFEPRYVAESCLDLHLHEAFGLGGHVDADGLVQSLRQSLLWRRLQHNPGYYGLETGFSPTREQQIDDRQVEQYLTQVLEEALEEVLPGAALPGSSVATKQQ